MLFDTATLWDSSADRYCKLCQGQREYTEGRDIVELTL